MNRDIQRKRRNAKRAWKRSGRGRWGDTLNAIMEVTMKRLWWHRKNVCFIKRESFNRTVYDTIFKEKSIFDHLFSLSGK